MIELKALENKYSKNYREVFEDLATLLFCTELDLSSGVNRRINQNGIESDPVRKGDKVYAYQAKYYEESTRIKERKGEIIDSIQVARKKGVTNLYLFINKLEPDKKKETGEEVSYIKAIEDVARGEPGQTPIQLEWWTKSKIESTLTQEGSKFDYIRNIYFKEQVKTELSKFYEYAYKRLIKRPQNTTYDTMPLQNSYIEPYLGDGQSVREFLEEYVKNEEEHIAVISGERGQGKTSLCYKAMVDYIKKGWLSTMVSNVFCFSLNPAKLSSESVYSDGSFNLSPFLSWGNDRKNQTLTYEDCKDALIFFDGFDELLEKYSKESEESSLIYSRFFEWIRDFQEDTNSHIIITCMNVAVVGSDEYDDVSGEFGIQLHSLQYVSRPDQEKWISTLKDYWDKERDPEKAKNVEDYLNHYREMDAEDDIKSILGIPRIFRIVVDGLIPLQKGQPVTEFYEKLFLVNWHGRRRSDSYSKKQIIEKLRESSLKIFLSNSETVEIDNRGDASWIFSYYMKKYGDGKVGFLNDSFYRFFLAKEIFSWYEGDSNENIKNDQKIHFQEKISNLAQNKLDMKTIGFIKELFERCGCRKNDVEKNFSEAYNILKSSLSEMIDDRNMKHPTDHANNLFYNIVSVGSACGQRVSVHNTDIKALRYYDLSGCILNDADLSGRDVDLRGVLMKAADLKNVNFSEACLRGADFGCADLSGAIFAGADLRGASFGSSSDAEYVNSTFIETKLCGSNFQKALLQGADFNAANLFNADFRGANINGANFEGAHFENTKFSKDDGDVDWFRDEKPDGIVWC